MNIFFQKYYTLPVFGFRGGSVQCTGARVSRAATLRTCSPTPGVAAPVPCALPRATEPGRPTACHPPPFRRQRRRNPHG